MGTSPKLAFSSFFRDALQLGNSQAGNVFRAVRSMS